MNLRLACLSSVLGTAAVVTAATPTLAMVAPASEPVAAPVATSTLTLHVNSCERCPITLFQALQGRLGVWESPTRRVDGGSVVFTVPTARTHGMSITVAPRWQDFDAVPLVVFRYADTKVGQVVPNALARTKTRGTPCWAGTTASDVSLNIRVVSYAHRSQSGEPGRTIRAWSKTTRHGLPPYLRAYNGTVGTQDAAYCGG